MRTGTVTLKALYEAIRQVQHKLDRLASLFAEDGRLSDAALDALHQARDTPDTKYVRLQ
jgi:hypothetical protein